MSWIEGVGDEVPIFFMLAILVVAVFMVLAWKSTHVPEPSTPLLEDHLRFTVASDSSSETISDLLMDLPTPPLDTSISNVSRPEESSSLVQEQPVEEAKDETTPIESNSESTETILQSEEIDDTGSKIRRRILETTQAQETISIRLKYLDDTQRIIESSTSTTLGEFKRSNFSAELGANKVVRLIFNGQVLNDDTQSLTQLGLDNNCVVHCLIHQARTNTASSTTNHESNTNYVPPSTPSQESSTSGRSPESGTVEAGIDIGGLLVPLFGVILALVWYCRIAYSTHFTAAATTALIGLSGLCVLSAFVVWHPTAAVDQTR